MTGIDRKAEEGVVGQCDSRSQGESTVGRRGIEST